MGLVTYMECDTCDRKILPDNKSEALLVKAKELGWLHNSKETLCPKCQEKIKSWASAMPVRNITANYIQKPNMGKEQKVIGSKPPRRKKTL